ncbi:uncharacterized protein LTR77_001011 [Saxophila tyrrhenica]|uniref:Uncharacterized protein n=1 Tax=Saxophila tyrrhenica TaxID=1690608 RepID=A0AAV9PPC8_9PEZI|nr:hypothetical protein LTR77_001011 [Saxophila tyrrhenica]
MAGTAQSQPSNQVPDTCKFTSQGITAEASNEHAATEFHSISAMPAYRNFSFEELRLHDYSNGGRGVYRHNSSRTNFSFEAAEALAWATVPRYDSKDLAFAASRRTSSHTMVAFRPPTVTLRAGKVEQQDFAFHKEARERAITLPDDLPETVELYQHFVYRGDIAPNSFGDGPKDSSEYQLLARAYILGERFFDAPFKDAIIDSIIHKLRTSGVFDTRLTNLIYANVPVGSQLKRLLVDIYTFAGSREWLNEEAVGEEINSEFVLELSKRQMDIAKLLGPKVPMYVSNTCGYHEYPRGVVL